VFDGGFEHPKLLCGLKWRRVMRRFSPELIQVMRTALNEAMTNIPPERATSAVKAHVAELILKTAANGQTSYYGLIAAASGQIQTILSRPM
jgi:hypothetical protein